MCILLLATLKLAVGRAEPMACRPEWSTHAQPTLHRVGSCWAENFNIGSRPTGPQTVSGVVLKPNFTKLECFVVSGQAGPYLLVFFTRKMRPRPTARPSPRLCVCVGQCFFRARGGLSFFMLD